MSYCLAVRGVTIRPLLQQFSFSVRNLSAWLYLRRQCNGEIKTLKVCYISNEISSVGTVNKRK
jgi:hypothetical protein